MVHFRVMIPIVTSDTATPPFNHAEHTGWFLACMCALLASWSIRMCMFIDGWQVRCSHPCAIVIAWQPVSVCWTRTFLFHCLSRPTAKEGN